MFLQPGKLIIGGIGLLMVAAAIAETWPPLRPPNPLPVDWVIKQVLTRYPEVHVGHRDYLAALERIPRSGGDSLRRQIAAHDAELSRLRAIEHHLALQLKATQVFYDFALADRRVALMEAHRRLIEAYIPALKGRTQSNTGTPRDLALEAAHAHAQVIRLEQERDAARLQLNTLMEHRLDAPLPVPKLGNPTALPPDRNEMINQALKNGVAMRAATVEVLRTGVAMQLAESERISDGAAVGLRLLDRSAPAATHEAAGAQDRRRAIGSETVRRVMTAYDLARSRRDMLVLYENTVLPRTEQLVQTTLASYQSGRADLFEVLDAYQRRYSAEIEMLEIRVAYEQAMAELTRLTGVLPPYMERKMSPNQLNVGGADR